jgi:hypothetical protein
MSFRVAPIASQGGPVREIQTFVLRLLVDTEEPHILQGAVHPVDSDDTHSFPDGVSLLTLLQRISQSTASPSDPRDSDES